MPQDTCRTLDCSDSQQVPVGLTEGPRVEEFMVFSDFSVSNPQKIENSSTTIAATSCFLCFRVLRCCYEDCHLDPTSKKETHLWIKKTLRNHRLWDYLVMFYFLYLAVLFVGWIKLNQLNPPKNPRSWSTSTINWCFLMANTQFGGLIVSSYPMVGD